MAALTPEQYNAMGNEALSLQDFQMAIKYYSMGLSHDVDQELHPVILSNRSPAYAHTGQWALALQDADTCVALRPTWPRGYACRGAALEGMGKTLEALDAFKHAQKLSASNPELAEIVSDLERSLGITNNFQGTQMINAPLSVSLMHKETSDKIAGVGMHIMLDMVHGDRQKRIKVNSIADWSPLIGHAQPGDTLEEIDNIPCYTMTFEHASSMIIGRPGDTIILQFSRPGSNVKPWRITLPRVLPRTPQHNMQTVYPQKLVSPPTSTIFSPPPSQVEGARLVVSTKEMWNTRYGSQAEIETEYMLQMMEELSTAAGISPKRLAVHHVSTEPTGSDLIIIRSHVIIYESQVHNSQVLLSSRDIVSNLIAQGNDARSKLRISRPAIFKIEEEARQTQNVSSPPRPVSPLAVQEVKESDLMRNFRIELETLTFFIQADHDEKLLYECSRVGDKLKPVDVLKPYEAANKLKRANVQLQKELEDLERLRQERDHFHQENEQFRQERDQFRQERDQEREQFRQERDQERDQRDLLLAELDRLRHKTPEKPKQNIIIPDKPIAISVRIVSLQNLPDSKVDPYVVVEYAGNEYETLVSTASGKRNPNAEYTDDALPDHVFIFGVDFKEKLWTTPHMVFTVKNKLAKNEVIGTCYVGRDKIVPMVLGGLGKEHIMVDHLLDSSGHMIGTEMDLKFHLVEAVALGHFKDPFKKPQVQEDKRSVEPIKPPPQNGVVASDPYQVKDRVASTSPTTPNGVKDVEDGRPLPPGWTVEQHDGQILYVDHKNRCFSYVHPLDLPRVDGQEPITNSRPGTVSVPPSSLQRK